MVDFIPFNQPFVTGKEVDHFQEVCRTRRLSGEGTYTQLCQDWLAKYHDAPLALLTHSCTAALELSALLADLQPGDEVIMPSFTFVTTASSFALRGAVPVFVDIRPDTLNLNEALIEQAITPKTKAICVVHYAGVASEMDAIMALAERRGLFVIEDGAHSIASRYKGKIAGSFGHMAALSFHETKNIVAGEGGALLINDRRLIDRARILWQKGTNKSQFLMGQVDKYTWVDLGSSFPPSELVASFLWAQLAALPEIQERRLAVWNGYHAALESVEKKGFARRPVVPAHCEHNAHIYYLLLAEAKDRLPFIDAMKEQGISTPFHYIPLHSSPGGLKYGRAAGSMQETDRQSSRLVRLPLSADPSLDYARVSKVVREYFGA